MSYAVPIAAPQPAPSGGSQMYSSATNPVNVPYDVGREFPLDPFRLWLAWANGQWIVTSIYNGR